MPSLEKRIPPPLLGVLSAFLIWVIALLTPTVHLALSIRLSGALILILTGMVIAFSGVAAIKKANSTISPLTPESTSSLVTDGIYQYTRNPMYVGLALWLSAWALYWSAPWAAVVIAAFIIYMNEFQIKPEEKALSALFADDYRQYLATVRRWL